MHHSMNISENTCALSCIKTKPRQRTMSNRWINALPTSGRNFKNQTGTYWLSYENEPHRFVCSCQSLKIRLIIGTPMYWGQAELLMVVVITHQSMNVSDDSYELLCIDKYISSVSSFKNFAFRYHT